jgi:hypothetical protein
MIKDEFVAGRFINAFSGIESNINNLIHFEMEKWGYLIYYTKGE